MTSPLARRALPLEIEAVRSTEGIDSGSYTARVYVGGVDTGYRTGVAVSAQQAEEWAVRQVASALGGLLHKVDY